ncbi:MAG: hypothetical protein FNT29_06450 [Halothiobacillaceae bacterium]|nr:MAG: hypothetical protein FNT29_06450 [Halothiobacillaceae bacterium]
MSPDGHRLTAASMGAAVAWAMLATRYPSFGAALESARTPMHDSTTWLALSFLLGALMGGRAPDWMEFNRAPGGGRRALIPHRTLTHWPPLWLGLGLLGLHLAPSAAMDMACTGFVMAALLHLLMDFLTPMGIPLWSPFGKRHAFGLYSSGSMSEAPWVVVVSLAFLAVGVSPSLRGALLSVASIPKTLAALDVIGVGGPLSLQAGFAVIHGCIPGIGY